MTVEELEEWAEDLEAFQARFAHLFARSEPREQAAKYLRGLLAPVERKNSWQLAETMGDTRPDKMQRLLYSAEWDADMARDELQRFVIEVFGDEDGIGVVDETGFLKKGSKSAGVKRQYSGTAGKVENCQIGTLLVYVSSRGFTFLDRRLYLPQEWCADTERRAEAKVPDEVEFRTKPQQATEMLKHAWEAGVPMRWVTGDEVYGDAPALRDLVIQTERLYVLAVSSHTPVWTERPQVEEPAPGSKGRPRTKPRLAEGAEPASTVAAVVASWPARHWHALTVAQGEKGPIVYDWGLVRVVESREGIPGPDAWLLARRSQTDLTDIAYYLSNTPEETPMLKLAQVASTRYRVEQGIEEAKGETGLDEYEVRHWHSWHRHITLSMMAHAWLASIRSKSEEKGGQIQNWQA
jgi:SRSO17 transposase